MEDTLSLDFDGEVSKKFSMVNGAELVDMRFDELQYCVGNILPKGLALLCGMPKVGKSWLVLDMCVSIANGEKFWNFETEQKNVLYFCLEDNFRRIQDRVFSFTDDLNEKVHFCVSACSMSDGLFEQMENYIEEYPDTSLIVVDTFQKVRNNTDMSYANDYGEIGLLKDFADRNKLTVLLIHHLRKQNDSDPVNKISGTTGLSGAADTILLLDKSKRNSNNATLYCVGRDIKEREIELAVDTKECRWKLIADSVEEPEILLPDEL